jgi:hypothetical protein
VRRHGSGIEIADRQTVGSESDQSAKSTVIGLRSSPMATVPPTPPPCPKCGDQENAVCTGVVTDSGFYCLGELCGHVWHHDDPPQASDPDVPR